MNQKQQMEFGSIILSVALSLTLSSSLSFGKTTPFTDDFESGNLDNWVIGGRQLGTNIADVVSRGGSQVARLYHRYFTEITLHRDFDYDPMDSYRFDLEVDVSSQSPPASNYYGWSYLAFQFLDSTDTSLGYVWYGAATTNYPFNNSASNPAVSANAIPENIMTHYEVSIKDMLSEITIDQTQIDSVRLLMRTYSSTWPYPDVTAQLWADNIQLNPPSTVPVPSALGLVGFGVCSLLSHRRKNRNGRSVKASTLHRVS